MQSSSRHGEMAWTVIFEHDTLISVIGEFVEFERRCCRFLRFVSAPIGTAP